MDDKNEKTVTQPDGTTEKVASGSAVTKTTSVTEQAEQEAQENRDSGPTVVKTKENTYTYRQGQGNSNPEDFKVFGDGGNFIEKRDR